MNIWEVVSITDLIKIIKEHPKQFIMLGITLDKNDNSIKSYIKKFLKQKSKLYPNIIFLYFKASLKDLGKISLLDKDINLYPLIYSIYDVSTVFIKITSAVEESIEEAFKAGKEYYDNDLLKFIESKNKPKNIIINNIQQEQENEDDKEVIDNQEDEITKQQEIMQNQQKLFERVVNLQHKAEAYNLEILKDIKNRKKEEEKIKKK